MKPVTLFNKQFEVDTVSTPGKLILYRSFLFTFETITIDGALPGFIESWNFFGGEKKFPRSEKDAIIVEYVRHRPRLRLSFKEENLSDAVLLLNSIDTFSVSNDPLMEHFKNLSQNYNFQAVDARKDYLIP